MKNYLKALIALMLVLACVFACVSCKPSDNNDTPGNTDGGGGNVVQPPQGDNTEIEEETYRIRFVYSYTAKVVNDNGRTENKKEVVTVKSIYVNVDNNGLSAEDLAEINGLTYNGYSFVSWHAEWNKDTQTAESAAADFNGLGKITKDLTFYGERGNLAGPNATWEIVYQYPEVEEEEEVVAAADDAQAPADGETQAPADGETEEPEEEVAPIGATLYIKGSGRMFDFANGNEIDIKWFKDYKLINTVVIQDGITNVGSNSFKNFTKLVNVKHFATDPANAEDGFPASITEIGDSAFMGTGLKKLATPAGLTVIQKNGFANTSLKEVTLNEGLVTLGQQAFYGSNKIKSIVIPSTLKTIANSAFHAGAGNSHNLKSVYYMGEEAGYKTIDIAMDNQPLSEFATIYYYKSYESTGGEPVLGEFWHYAEEEFNEDESTWVHPVQYCFTLSYTYEAASKIPFKYISVPARPQQDEDGNTVLDEEGVPILTGVITEEIYNAQKNIRYHEKEVEGGIFYFESFTGGTALNVGTVITADQNYKCVRGDILSEDGGIRFTSVDGVVTVYKDDTTEQRITDDVTAALKSEIKKSLTAEETEGLDDAAIAALVDTKFAAEEIQAELKARVDARLEKAFKIWDFRTTADTGLLWVTALSGLSKIQQIVIGEGVEYIGALTFTGLSSVKEVVIPASVKGVGTDAFGGCSALVSVYYEGSVETDCPDLANVATSRTGVYSYVEGSTDKSGKYWTNIGESTIAWELDVENGILVIGGDNVMVNFETADAAPWYVVKDSIKSVSVAINVTNIGANIVNGYENVVSISLHPFVKIIPESAFIGTGILNDTSKYDKGLLIVNDHLLKVDASKRDEYFFETPYGLYTIADGAFKDCSSIKRIYLTKTISCINPDAFPDSDIEYIFTEGDETYWETIKQNVDFGDAKVLYKSDKRPLATVTDENGNSRMEYVNGKHWRKIGNEYVIWGCDHVWSDWITTTPATCYAAGTETRYCLFDKLHTQFQSIPETEHVYKNYVADDNATCVTAQTETAKCENLGCTSTDTRDILVLMVDENGDPVLDSEGNETYDKVYGTCNFEGATYVENGDQDCTHGMTETANCLNEGCTKTDTRDVADKGPLGHIGADNLAWDQVTYTLDANSATCQKPYGTKSKTCARSEDVDGFTCGHVETIDATAEDHPSDYVKATCVFDQETVAPKYLAAAATKTSPAKYYKSCKICGAAGTDTFDSGSALSFYDFEAEGQKAADMCTPGTNYTMDPAAGAAITNNYAKIESFTENDVTNKVLAVGRGTAPDLWGQLTIASKNAKTADDVVYVIDTDFMVDQFTFVGTENWLTRISMYNGSTRFATLLLKKVDDTTITIYVCEDEHSDEKATGINLTVDTWYNIRVEYDVASKTVAVVATNKADGTAKNALIDAFEPTKSTASFNSIMIEMRATATNYIVDTQYCFDDLYFGAVSYGELYGERPVAAE